MPATTVGGTPENPAASRQTIERYSAAGFRVSGVVFAGPVLVFPHLTIAWEAAAATLEALAPVIEHGGIELVLLGLGRRGRPVAPPLRAALKARGIGIEAMDTGAACRTYNVLLAEDRLVAAALLPPI
ncbi:MAG TPA: Mth938-like domain-containing protein [Stellaceae bacterium]|nr:Mth938-like domain-containing protein [Stellaceae bacterium]